MALSNTLAVNGGLLVNLTPHGVSVVVDETTVLTLGGTTAPARVTVEAEDLAPVFGVIPLTRTTFGAVQGLPDEQPNTLLLVSRIVKAAAGSRTDLVCPGELLRDSTGAVIGCRGLSL